MARHNTKKAVEELAIRGAHSFCPTLDPKADDCIARSFGPKNRIVVDRACLRPPTGSKPLKFGKTNWNGTERRTHVPD